MSFASSCSAFRQVWREDRELARLGPCRGRLLAMHYRGRIEARFDLPQKVGTLHLKHFSRMIDLTLSAPYLGALKGVFLDVEYDCSGVFERPPRRILDLGANIGMGALTFSCQFPGAEFVCVEPDPRNLDLLRTNLDQNGIRAEIVPAAVAVASGKSSLRFNSDPTCSRLESLPEQDLHELTGVDLVTVPEVLERVGWETVDLVKIDIEGAEDEILSSNNEWLEKVGAIILEIHPITTPEKIFAYIKDYGFSVRRHGSGREPVYFCERS
jgi:FkbM family methyltransferase